MNQWYCNVGGAQYGPADEHSIRDWIGQGRIGPNDYVWSEGMADWARAAAVFADLFPGVAPIPVLPGLVPAMRPGGTGGQTPNRDVRARARQALSGRWGLPIGFSLVFMLLTMAIGMLPYLGGIAQLILSGPLELGLIVFYITFARGANAEFGMMFRGFQLFGPALGAYILRSVFVSLWMLLAALPGGVISIFMIAAGLHYEAAVIAIVLAAIPAMIVGVIAQLRYAMTFYLLADRRTLGPLGAIRESTQLMAGNKGKLFMLGLSFIGWYLLCILSFGIGFLWFVPYMSVSFAKFYDDLHPPAGQAAFATAGPSGAADVGAPPPSC